MSIMFAKLTKLSKLSLLLLGVGAASLLATPAQAEKMPLEKMPLEEMSLNEKFKEVYFTNGKNAFIQGNFLSQIESIVGFTGYPEQHVNRDAQAVDKLYQMAIETQAATGARIMTRDLPNPYDTSLRENPSYSAIK